MRETGGRGIVWSDNNHTFSKLKKYNESQEEMKINLYKDTSQRNDRTPRTKKILKATREKSDYPKVMIIRLTVDFDGKNRMTKVM